MKCLRLSTRCCQTATPKVRCAWVSAWRRPARLRLIAQQHFIPRMHELRTLATPSGFGFRARFVDAGFARNVSEQIPCL